MSAVPLKDVSPRFRNRRLAPVIAAFVLVALGFVVAAVVSELWASGIDEEAAQIEQNALPSVEHLSAARDSLWHLETAADGLVEAPPDQQPNARFSVENARREVEHELAVEFATREYPEEAARKADVLSALASLDAVLRRLSDEVAVDPAQARALLRHDARGCFDSVDAALHRLSSLNAKEGHAGALKIARVRASAVRVTFGLTVACVVFAIVAALMAVRALQRQRDLERAQEELLAARSTELERFAARVAHDLLSPLSSLHFTLSSLKRNTENGLPVASVVERAEACIRRARALVEGVMDFARSGASPAAARASLSESLAGVLEEARADAGDVELVVQGDEQAFVACSPGILTSILSNLVRNALKYMDGPEKRVTVRTAHDSAMVHVEVEDTGPGLPRGLEEHVFDAYVRGPDNPKPGLGLGLATVKRFVESHGGHVGVESSPGRGCTFWFDLPSATAPGPAA